MRNSSPAIGYLLLLLLHSINCSNIIGNVTIGLGCKIHASARILALGEAIIVGNNNLIGTQVKIENLNYSEPLIIGNNNTFESGAHCESASMGNNNLLEHNSYLGPSIELGNNNIVGVNCRLASSNIQSCVSNTELRCPELLEMKTCLVGDPDCKTSTD